MANFGFLLRCSSPSTEVDRNVSYVCKLTPEFVVGRAQSSALCISDISISRTHCVFSFNSDNQLWTVQDQSRTGTWVNSKRILPNTATPLQISDVVCFGPTSKFQYTFRTYHTDGSSSSSSGTGSESSDLVKNSTSAGISTSRLSSLAGSSNSSSDSGASLKFIVRNSTLTSLKPGVQMAESETSHVAWSDGGPSSSLASSSHVTPCINEAGPSSSLKRAACSSDEVLTVKRTRNNEVRELSCQLEQLHVKECRLLKDMEEMLMSVQLKFHKNMALLREEQLKLAEKAEVQQRSRLVTELNIRENCNRALSGVRHRINEIHVQLKQKEFDDEDDEMVTSTLNSFEGILEKDELERLLESLRDSEKELQRRLELAEQERDGVQECCDGRQVGYTNPQRSGSAQPCSSEGGATENRDGQTSDATSQTSQTKAKTRPKLKAKRKIKPKVDDSEQVKKSLLQSIGNLMEEELQCSICNEVFLNAVTINCSHSFCRFCLNQWKQHRMECPMCRMPITGEYRSIAIDSFISSMMVQLGEDAQNRFKEMCAERAAREAARASTSGTSRPPNPSTSSGPPNPSGPLPGHSNGPNVSQVPVHTGRPWNGVYLLRRFGGNGGRGGHGGNGGQSGNGGHGVSAGHGGNHSGNGNGNPTAPPPNVSVPPPVSPDHRNSRSRRRHGRPAISPSNSSASSTEDQSEVSAYSGYSTPSWHEPDYSNHDYDEEDDSEYEPSAVVPGIPGRYYGGYGLCFYCRQRGHWSNGCPIRFRY